MKQLSTVALLCVICFSASGAESNHPSKSKESWIRLFDGKSLDGWRRFAKQEAPGSGWVVEKDGTLHLLPGAKGGDIIHTNQFTNFELQWEWRLAPKANNGVKYLVSETRPNSPGPEYQMVDDATMEPRHQTASLYDILPPETLASNPVGEWNSSRIVIRGKHVEHWLNGKRTVQYELESPELRDAISKSKFKNVAGFDKKITGHILLTDHHDEAWYRNIRIRPISD